MDARERWKLDKLLRYYPTVVDDRLRISISGKEFLVQNRQVREREEIDSNFFDLVEHLSGEFIRK